MWFFALLFLIGFSACESASSQPYSAVTEEKKTSGEVNPARSLPSSGVSIQKLLFDQEIPLTLSVEGEQVLPLQVVLSDGQVVASSQVGTISWAVTNPQVATITSEGVLQAHALGSTVIRASLQNHSVLREVIVAKPPQPVVAIPIIPTVPMGSKPQPVVIPPEPTSVPPPLPVAPPAPVVVVPPEPTPPPPAPVVMVPPEPTPPPPPPTPVVVLPPEPSPPPPTKAVDDPAKKDPPPDPKDPPKSPEDNTEKPKVVVEEPADFADRFLGPEDELNITYGTNGGFGSHLFPTIVYGMPQTGGKDVVALGGGGTLEIKLHGFLVADGDGPDFTLFENAVYSKKLNVVFAERAQVSVSQDGETFFDYPCDVNNVADFYPGCAGVHEVFPLQDPTDPAVSGGDHYDLADVGLPWIQYIRIQDLDTCHPGDPTYETQQFKYLCTGPGVQGFDLDAVAIVNGVKELTIIKQ